MNWDLGSAAERREAKGQGELGKVGINHGNDL